MKQKEQNKEIISKIISILTGLTFEKAQDILHETKEIIFKTIKVTSVEKKS